MSSKVKNIIIIVFGCVILVLICFICFLFLNNHIFDEDKNVIDKKEDDIKYDISKSEAFKLFDIFISDINSNNTGGGAIDPMLIENDSILLSDLDEDDLFNIVRRSLKTSDRKDLFEDEVGLKVYSINKSTLNDYASLYFNKKIELPDSFWDFPAECKVSDDEYICKYIITGAELVESWAYFPIDYNIEGSILTINGFAVYEVFEGYIQDETLYYDDVYCSYNVLVDDYGYDYYDENSNEVISKCLIDNNLDKKHPISIKFNLKNNKRLFISINK